MNKQAKVSAQIGVCFLFFAVPMQNLCGQNVSSPYSILGIGDVDTKDYGRYFGSGSASISRRDENAYNYANPAALTALPFKHMNFDVAGRGRIATFTYPNADSSTGVPSNDFVVKRVSMAFRTSEKSGAAFGLRPYSSVNYLYIDDEAILDGNTSYFKRVEGSGGINQVYASYARAFGTKFSAGITASWLFGSLQRQTQYLSPAIDLNITKDEKDFYNGAILQAGIQYYSLPGKKWRHQLGLTASTATALSGQFTAEYLEADISINKEVESGRSFMLPNTIGFGYSAVNKERLTLSIEGNYYNWPYQKVNYPSSYTYPSFRTSMGMEYSIKDKRRPGQIEKGFLSAGLSAENSYMRIKDNNLLDFAFSVGAGKTITRNLLLYTGIEVGTRGNKAMDQIKEQYTQFIFGLTIKDLWLGSKYARKYD